MSGRSAARRTAASVVPGDRISEVYHVARVERRRGRNGIFLRLRLVDRSGALAGVVWDDVERLAGVLVEGAYAHVEGEAGEYQGTPQLRVTDARPATDVDPAEFLARGSVTGAESVEAIRRIAATIEDPWLGRLVSSFLDDPVFVTAFAASPAAKMHHHAYVGGLAEHTHSVMRLAEQAAGHYGDLDRDLLLTGAFLHDIGKTVELAVEPGFPYTEEGTLMGHIALGFSMVRERIAGLDGFPSAQATDVGHLVLSHQGQLEWGSPVLPQTLEAITLHFIDNLDSKVAAARVHLADVEHGRTAFVRSLGRSLFRRGPAPVTEPGEPPPGAGEAESGDRADPPPANAPPSLFDD